MREGELWGARGLIGWAIVIYGSLEGSFKARCTFCISSSPFSFSSFFQLTLNVDGLWLGFALLAVL